MGIREWTNPRWRNIIAEDRIIAAGLATSCPSISLATCRHPGSKRANSYFPRHSSVLLILVRAGWRKRTKRTRPILAPGTIPGPPTRAAPMLEMMDPYLLFVEGQRQCSWKGIKIKNEDAQVGHDHDIKLLRFSDQLHRSVIDDWKRYLNVPSVACFEERERELNQAHSCHQKQFHSPCILGQSPYTCWGKDHHLIS